MIKLYCYAICTFFYSILDANLCNGQSVSFEKIEWDILKIGFGVPFGEPNTSTGSSIGTEIRYNIINPISMGLGVTRLDLGSELTDSFHAKPLIWKVSVDYYYNTMSGNRFFTGASYGRFSNGAQTFITGVPFGSSSLPSKMSSGLEIRIGQEFNQIRILSSYNLSFDSEVINYLDITIAYTIGGKYRN